LIAVASVDELLDGDGGDQRSGNQSVARLRVFDTNTFDIKALGLERAEQLLYIP
jgi:hypothetical protein